MDSSTFTPIRDRSVDSTPSNATPPTPPTDQGSGLWTVETDSAGRCATQTPASLAAQLYNLDLSLNNAQPRTGSRNNWLVNTDESSNLQFHPSAPSLFKMGDVVADSHCQTSVSSLTVAPNGSPMPRQSSRLQGYVQPRTNSPNNRLSILQNQQRSMIEQLCRAPSKHHPLSVREAPLDQDTRLRRLYGPEGPEGQHQELDWTKVRQPAEDGAESQQRPPRIDLSPALTHLGFVPTSPTSRNSNSSRIACDGILRPPPGLRGPFEAIPTPAPVNSPLKRQTTYFRPMAAVGDTPRPSLSTTRNPLTSIDASEFSGNYRGEHNARNASAKDLPDELNCALWLTNLPPDITHRELLAHIRRLGRIWCTHINPPCTDSRHVTAAAKVVFFTPEPARQLLVKALTEGFVIRDRFVRVTYNRIKTGAQPLPHYGTRVLIITGKTEFVNERSLIDFFSDRFVFEVDEVECLISAKGRSVVMFSFGSYRNQAQMGPMAFAKDKPQGLEHFEFGEDPCEMGETMSAYGVAGRRIQGFFD